MNCHKVKQIINDSVMDAVSEEEREEMTQHLQACSRCRREWADQLKLWGVAGNYPEPPEAGEGFTASVMQKVQMLEDEHTIIELPQRRRVHWSRAVAAGLVASLLVGGIIMLRYNSTWAIQLAGADGAVDDTIIANLDVIENLELLNNLEFYTDLDLVEGMDDSI